MYDYKKTELKLNHILLNLTNFLSNGLMFDNITKQISFI